MRVPIALLVSLAAAHAEVPPPLENPLHAGGPSAVQIEHTPKGWRMLRNGWPYFVRGACVWGENVRLNDLVAAGGNSLRTYHSKYARWTLDAAQRRGLTVMLGYEINSEHGGFSYLSGADLAAQRERYLGFVKKHRDHPALLVWAIGNEVEQGVEDPAHLEAMWRELNTLARMTKEIDPRHPTAIVLAGANEEKLAAVSRWCPDVDLICFNMYGGLRNLPDRLDKLEWRRPYLVTEFGATGWWEAPKTAWGAPIEMTSTEKAREYLSSYERGVLGDRRRCLGSYVFFWEPKQEATSTWFGMFLAGGERLEMIDAMTQAWSRRPPHNRSPQIKTLEFADAKDQFIPGEPIRVKLSASDPDRDMLGVWWRLSEEAPGFTLDNAYEAAPRMLREHSIVPTAGGAEFPAPGQPGAYRIFVYVYDGQGNAATGNLCFAVNMAPAPPAVEFISPTESN